MTDELRLRMERAAAFAVALHSMKGALSPHTPRETYDDLRERYASGQIELEDFTAGVVKLLREGL